MTFGKEQDPREAGRKGAIASATTEGKQKIHNAIAKKMADPTYRKQWSERSVKSGRKGIAKAVKNNPSLPTIAGKRSRLYENETAKKIQADEVFLPQEVCDRIAIRNGQISFIEIKKEGQKLRPKQKRFAAIAKERYEIIYYKPQN